jgi:hypothetical protein
VYSDQLPTLPLPHTFSSHRSVICGRLMASTLQVSTVPLKIHLLHASHLVLGSHRLQDPFILLFTLQVSLDPSMAVQAPRLLLSARLPLPLAWALLSPMSPTLSFLLLQKSLPPSLRVSQVKSGSGRLQPSALGREKLQRRQPRVRRKLLQRSAYRYRIQICQKIPKNKTSLLHHAEVDSLVHASTATRSLISSWISSRITSQTVRMPGVVWRVTTAFGQRQTTIQSASCLAFAKSMMRCVIIFACPC